MKQIIFIFIRKDSEAFCGLEVGGVLNWITQGKGGDGVGAVCVCGGVHAH
jgi:hypothetical protein